MIIAVANQKGGVGKTTTVVALSVNLRDLGFRVAVIDLDPQANATETFGLLPEDVVNSSMFTFFDTGNWRKLPGVLRETESGVWIAPSHIGLAHTEHRLYARVGGDSVLAKGIDHVRGEFDVILVDCPPSLSILTYNAMVACDTVLAPIQAEPYALNGLSMLKETIDATREYGLNPRCGLGGAVLTLVDRRRNVDARVGDILREALGEISFETAIPRDVRLVEMAENGNIDVLRGTSNAATAYFQLAKEVVARWLV